MHSYISVIMYVHQNSYFFLKIYILKFFVNSLEN